MACSVRHCHYIMKTKVVTSALHLDIYSIRKRETLSYLVLAVQQPSISCRLMRCSSSEAADKVRNMWSYRLYRYSSPSSSRLVYGVGSADLSMPRRSPSDLARAVFKALETGTDLPQLPPNPEVLQALMVFQPEDSGSCNQEGKDDEGCRGCNSDDNRERGREPTRTKSCDEHLLHDRRVTSAVTSQQRSPTSFLMLEALRRRRLDAVQQLHEAFPQLLASLPIFVPLSSEDHKPPLVTPTSVAQPSTCRSHHYHHYTAGASIFDVPPAQKMSPLLDAAVENRAMLIFVLQNHPDLQRNATAVPAYAKLSFHEMVAKDNNVTLARILATDLESQGQRDDVGAEVLQADDLHQLLPELHPFGPVAICLRQNVPEVLQYLLYKHVWQHFLLEDIALLPQNSQVPDLDGRWAGKEWFLHCAALMGCPMVLQGALAGAYDVVTRKRHAAAAADSDRPDLSSANAEPPSDICSSESQMEEEQEAPPIPGCRPRGNWNERTETVDNVDSARQRSRPHALIREEKEQEEDDEADANEPSQESVTKEFTGNPPVRPAVEQDDEGRVVEGIPRTMTGLEDEGEGTQAQASRRHVNKVKCGYRGQKEGAGIMVGRSPNPDAPLAVSLPVMDRWISRCMHVRVTPLHLACWRCDAASIRILLKHGADVNVTADELEECEDQKSSAKTSGSGLSSQSGPPSSSTPHSSDSDLFPNFNPDDLEPFASSTVTSGSFNPGSNTSLESAMKAAPHEHSGVTPLALLALGVRSPPDFSLSIGRALGLVQATLPEGESGQVDRASEVTRSRVMDALRLLLDAGADVNATSTIFRKTFRPLELFLQPSVDLYYAPLMPRGGRDSAVLRCMDLERAGELVLGACWELLARGAELGAGFRSSVEWNLFRMDWMFLQDDVLKQRFLHLAIFLGLFPPCCQLRLLTCSCRHNHDEASTAGDAYSQRDACASRPFFTGNPLPEVATQPPQPLPTANITSQLSTFDLSSITVMEQDGTNIDPAPESNSDPPTYLTSTGSFSGESSHPLHNEADLESLPGFPSSDGFRLEQNVPIDVGTSTNGRAAALGGPRSVDMATTTPLHLPGCPARDVPARWRYQTQLWLWAVEERQHRILERCVIDIVRLSVSPRTLLLLLRFLAFPDLRVMASLTDNKFREWRAETASADRLREAVWQAHTRSLKHSAKVVILIATRWRHPALQSLPLPESLKRYLTAAFC